MDDTGTDDLDLVEQIGGKLMTYLAKLISQDDLKNVQAILDGGDPGLPEGAMDRARRAVLDPGGDGRRAERDPAVMAAFARQFPGALSLKRR